MKKFVLLKEGRYTSNVFADVMEAFNNYDERAHEREKIHYYVQSDLLFRIHKNFKSGDSQFPISLVHFAANPYEPTDDPNLNKPLDIEKLMQAADDHEIALLTTVTTKNDVSHADLLTNSICAVRNNEGHLINYDTKERLIPEGNRKDTHFIQTVTFFGVIKVKHLPIYYIITDPRLVKIGDGFDFLDEDNNVVYREIADSDGKIKDNIIAPTVGDDATMVNDHIFTSGDTITIRLFNHPENLFVTNEMAHKIPSINMVIQTNYPYFVSDNEITVTLDTNLGFIKILPELGHFHDAAEHERVEYNYIIHKI